MLLKFLRSRIAEIQENLNLKTNKKIVSDLYYFPDNNFNLNQKLKQENETCQQKVGQLKAENSQIEYKSFPSTLETLGENSIPESER